MKFKKKKHGEEKRSENRKTEMFPSTIRKYRLTDDVLSCPRAISCIHRRYGGAYDTPLNITVGKVLVGSSTKKDQIP